jgi:erythromycin esterase-like protein
MRDDFTAWATAAAVTFDSLDDTSANVARLAPVLDPLLENKRAVYIGEPDHWIHEKNACRRLFVRSLFERGWRVFAEELSWFDGLRIDRYVETGDESQLDRIATYGYTGADRTDRDDRPTGLLRAGWDTYPVAEFRAEQLRFARFLRQLNVDRPPGTPRLQFVGFDNDANPNVGYEHIDGMLDDTPLAALQDLRSALVRVPGESVRDEVARLDRALALIDAQPQSPMLEGLRYAVLTLRDSYDYASIAYPATTWDVVGVGMAMRERIMQRHLARLLETLPDPRLVLMAHNAHLAKDDRRIHAPGTVGPDGDRERAVGTWLHDRLNGEVASAWMLFDRGEDNQPNPDLPRKLRSPASSLNAQLARVGNVFALPTRSDDPRARPLSSPAVVSMLYNALFHLTASEQADLIFFIRKVTPLRLDP